MNRGLFVGSATLEVDLTRYEELLREELKAKQYREIVRRINPSMVEAIEAVNAEELKTDLLNNEEAKDE